jgi:curved DNA-binding protein CbpA
MSRIHTHYDNLKVARDAPPEFIHAAYKTLAQKYHPDKNSGKTEATKIMSIINASYEVLIDPEKRHQHDAWIIVAKVFFSLANVILIKFIIPIYYRLSNRSPGGVKQTVGCDKFHPNLSE